MKIIILVIAMVVCMYFVTDHLSIAQLSGQGIIIDIINLITQLVANPLIAIGLTVLFGWLLYIVLIKKPSEQGGRPETKSS